MKFPLRFINNTGVEAELYCAAGTGLVINAWWAEISGGNNRGHAYQLQLQISSCGPHCPVLRDGQSLGQVLHRDGPTLDSGRETSRNPCRHIAEQESIAACLTAMRRFLDTLELDRIASAPRPEFSDSTPS